MKRIQLAIAATLVAGTMAVDVVPGEAHKPITSPYTYNDDIFPLVRDKCGSCHVSGGIAPMSLMSHADAVPWGESIRTELLAGHMPPASIDTAAGRFRNVSTLSPREMNVLLTWVTGGTPLGTPEKNPPPMVYEHRWRLGPPDLEVPFPREVTIGADEREQTAEFVIPIGAATPRGVRAVDVKPGNPAVVRAATISLRAWESVTPAMARTEELIGLWLPGDEPIPLDEGLAFELGPNTQLVVRVLYRKTWEYERKDMRDRSTLGLYFAKAPYTRVRALSLLNRGLQPPFDQNHLTFRYPLDASVRAIAIYPDGPSSNVRLRATATRPNGSRVELIAFHPRADWAKRYWFKEPIVLPRGTIIDISTWVDDESSLPLSVGPAKTTDAGFPPPHLILNFVPAP